MPDLIKVYVLPAHIAASTPALAVATALIVRTIASFTEAHGPDVVSVNVTLPAEISAAEGKYVAVIVDAPLKVPVPDDVHKPDVALPPIEPDSW